MSEPLRKRSSLVRTMLFVVTVLAILYPLSAGPAAWFYDHDYIPESTVPVFESLYLPIGWVCIDTEFLESNPIGRAYDKYLRWWGVY
jgi:hypothetical protein